MQEAVESFGGVPGVEAVLCRPPLSSIKKPVKWDVVSLVNNVQYGEEGVRVWRSGYKIHSLEQKHLECGRHKYVLEYETLYDRAVLGYAFRLEKGPSAVPQLLDTESTRHRL
ncbi:unnamed protein product [Pocillopora meandrina]|uniref:Uncharacterized protein n=1 Tax=Pocillopora meandrina TaxID=46732 RepID=A0AAU9VJZ8_9CNID|nr:unnamed protein product [Pocillopora meandrina]